MENSFATKHPELVCEWSEKNLPLMPDAVSYGSNKIYLWHGKCGHEWETVVKNRTGGAGCPYCSRNLILKGFNDLESQFPEIAAEWSQRNLPLLPSEVTAYSNKKVWWRCRNGHEWETLISIRSYGSSCPYCSGIRLLKGYNDLATCFPEIAAEWSQRNLPLTPDSVSVKSTWCFHICITKCKVAKKLT